ncbi:MAG: hypothetical protein WBW01_12555, partial [Terriglobales bacterium]
MEGPNLQRFSHLGKGKLVGNRKILPCLRPLMDLGRDELSPRPPELIKTGALQSAEKLDFVLAFGWRSGFTAAITIVFSV